MTTLIWKKSTRSNGGGNCVEVATPPRVVMVRDSKDRQGPTLSFTSPGWTSFVQALKSGTFDA
ncbi:DUF397 domain-containing protein [Micromonospora sp. WMMD998]|uniref:DUF397 domain-containing protein n=1 Tax=Micromonospora sp. WMMD998 TaxID=3016092 RepID=UPI00249B35DF|nr:DUF397 domain-containing protein [Micromonospora sp. WMMD998]WFE37250.1 DUF397 domain-containing protein [Micromonospora sp. WMMD998]